MEGHFFGNEGGFFGEGCTLSEGVGDGGDGAAKTDVGGGESKLFSTPLEGADHMMLVALDAMNPAHWVDGSGYSNWGLFFDLQRVLDRAACLLLAVQREPFLFELALAAVFSEVFFWRAPWQNIFLLNQKLQLGLHRPKQLVWHY